jgi:hypothetical protein
VKYSHDERDVAFGGELETVNAGSDSDVTSDINPGGLTFEEGQSSLPLYLQDISSTCDARYCRWDGSPPGCLQLHNAQVIPSPFDFFEISYVATSVGAIIGTGIFSTPSSILESVGSVGASLMLWVLGFAFSLCGLFVWLEFGTMFPRSGGEKVYLEAVYRRPKHLVTVVFAVNAVILNISSGNCIVSSLYSASVPSRILP